MQKCYRARETLFHKCTVPPIDHISAFLASLIMPSKRRLTQLKSARAATVLSSKRRKVEASLILNSAELEIDDDKLSTADTSDTEGFICGAFVWHTYYFKVSNTSFVYRHLLMVSLTLRQVAKQNFKILGLIQNGHVTKAVTQPPQQIIQHTAL